MVDHFPVHRYFRRSVSTKEKALAKVEGIAKVDAHDWIFTC